MLKQVGGRKLHFSDRKLQISPVIMGGIWVLKISILPLNSHFPRTGDFQPQILYSFGREFPAKIKFSGGLNFSLEGVGDSCLMCIECVLSFC